MKRLKIEPRTSYREVGPENPYVATIWTEVNKTSMQIELSDNACSRILQLAAEEIALAAKEQAEQFAKDALAVSKTPMIEGTTE